MKAEFLSNDTIRLYAPKNNDEQVTFDIFAMILRNNDIELKLSQSSIMSLGSSCGSDLITQEITLNFCKKEQ